MAYIDMLVIKFFNLFRFLPIFKNYFDYKVIENNFIYAIDTGGYQSLLIHFGLIFVPILYGLFIYKYHTIFPFLPNKHFWVDVEKKKMFRGSRP